MSLGFTSEAWTGLAEALCQHGRACDVVAYRETAFGPRYVVEGDLEAPSGVRAFVRSVWQFDHGNVAPRLITSYPVSKR